MKKVLCILLAILAVFALAAGGAYGVAWYRANHVFVGGDAYPLSSTELDLREKTLTVEEYQELQAMMPGCDITWMVPFQGGTLSSDSDSLTLTTLNQSDITLMKAYFPYLKKIDAMNCEAYDLLEELQKTLPSCDVRYDVDLGGKSFPLDSTGLTLQNGEYTLADLTQNLKHLPKVAELTLKTPDLTLAEIDQLKTAYPEVLVHCTVELLGQEYDNTTENLDLSAMTSEDVATMSEKLAMLPNLKAVELMDGAGKSNLTKDDVKSLMTMAPTVAFHYTFDFYGQTLSTDSEEIIIKDVKIGDAGEKDLRLALDLMPKCKRFVLDNCQFSSEVLAKVREDYRDQTKIVWRIWFSKRGNCLTDVEIFRSIGNLESNYKSVQYCEDVVYMDIGHNDMKDISFTAKMPKLRALIVSGSSISDLSPLSNCKELEFLELGFCGYVKDLSPLAECTSLRMLNIGNTKVEDLSALDGLPLTHLSAKRNGVGTSRVPKAEQERFASVHPTCWATWDGEQPYGIGWRYLEDNITYTNYYQMLRLVFRYDLDPNDPKQKGMYIDEIDDYLKDLDKKASSARTFAPYREAVEKEFSDWDAKTKALQTPAPEPAEDDKAETDPKDDAAEDDKKDEVKETEPKETEPEETQAKKTQTTTQTQKPTPTEPKPTEPAPTQPAPTQEDRNKYVETTPVDNSAG